ncbi:MAG: hypothetical protein LUG13_10105 [Oscillospiraceae bacterium]|nr:hypothetical protein [Oscillospiraceae bacterium]
MNSILFGESSFRLDGLPLAYQAMAQLSHPDSTQAGGQRRLNGGVVKAVLHYFGGAEAALALVKVSETAYASEMPTPEGIVLASVSANGSMRGALVTADGVYQPLPNAHSSAGFDTTPFLLAFLPILRDRFPDLDHLMDRIAHAHAHAPLDAELLFELSDRMVLIFEENRLETDDKGGEIQFLPEQAVKLGGLCYNKVICGTPVILRDTGEREQVHAMTIANAKEEFRFFSEQFHWSPEEEDMIPVFEPDFLIPDETMKLARFYVHSQEERRPMVNFMWRGVTAYGKSTGVELLAAILHMPLLRVTCHSNMETQDFLSDFVPNAVSSEPTQRPSVEEMLSAPEEAYYQITGRRKEGVSPDMCLDAYVEQVAVRESNVPRFKHVVSNYVKALDKGYIVEVQEISRIKNSGVLVGLNEYDRAGAIIPLVDGSYTRRHKNALVIYTDNVGYNSCHPIDPSVIRRMALIIDSYDLPKETALERLAFNTGVRDGDVLEKCYTVWDKIKGFCVDKGITDGSMSQSELEMWVLASKMDGFADLRQSCIECVVAKATNDREEQAELISSVVDLYL